MTKSKRKSQRDLKTNDFTPLKLNDFTPISSKSRFCNLDDEAEDDQTSFQQRYYEQKASNMELQNQFTVMHNSMQQMQHMMEKMLLRESPKNVTSIPMTPTFLSPGFTEINDLLSQTIFANLLQTYRNGR